MLVIFLVIIWDLALSQTDATNSNYSIFHFLAYFLKHSLSSLEILTLKTHIKTLLTYFYPLHLILLNIVQCHLKSELKKVENILVSCLLMPQIFICNICKYVVVYHYNITLRGKKCNQIYYYHKSAFFTLRYHLIFTKMLRCINLSLIRNKMDYYY